MRTKIIAIILIFAVSLSITGCMSNEGESNVENNGYVVGNTTSKPTSVPTDNAPLITNATIDEVSLAMNAYRDVLNNKTKFISSDHEKAVFLDDFLTDKEIYGAIYKPMHFTVLDMDGDEVPEVIIELVVGDDVQFYEILHYLNSEVYGYLRVLRGLMQLKTDATFTYSNGAADNGISKVEFDSTGSISDTVLGYSESSFDKGNITISYFVNDEPVTEEYYLLLLEEQDEKKEAMWYEFSEDSIETEFTLNP
ncbi:MAG: hypothetical protein GX815_12540 [Clostridiales bacterium]|nr:hypothetical protein [Clostridiales bacterium]